MTESDARRPEVSVIVPCFNEEGALGRALESLVDAYVLSAGEVLVVDGKSTDRTKEIAAGYVGKGWPIRILDNPGRTQSHGLNLGIRESRAPVIVRADAHSLYPEGFVCRCVALLVEHGADHAGGVMWPTGNAPFQKAVACAMRHPAGIGNARHHLGNYTGWTSEGPYLGAFRRDVFDKVGVFDPRAHPNEDADLILRMNAAGLKCWLDATIKVTYFPRSTIAALARQYFQYGRGRRYTTRKHRRLQSLRQAAPLALLFGLVLSLVLSPFHPAFLFFPGSYLAGLCGSALFVPCGKREPLGVRLRLVPVFATMHLVWAFGFLTGRNHDLTPSGV